MMKAAGVGAALLVFIIPAAFAAGTDAPGAGAPAITKIVRDETVKLAMGPTSAAHLPGGNPNQATGRTSNCSASTEYGSNSRKTAKYRYKPAPQN